VLIMDRELMLLNVIGVSLNIEVLQYPKKKNNIEVLKYCKVWPFILRVWTMGYGNEFDHKFKMATIQNECQYILSSIDMNISNHKMKLTAQQFSCKPVKCRR
jgi:hypothetical protein